MTTINWGILAPGNIARQFATCLPATSNGRLYAAASRDASKAQKFIDEFGGEVAYGSYDDLLADPKVDAIYIASPHTLHHSQAKACIDAGKPILVEKPICINSQQTKDLLDYAQSHQVFVMEAMWTRFLPIMVQVREWLAAGAIGDVRQVHASFGFRCGWNPEGRLLNPELAGGGILDVGVYVIALALDVFGAEPTKVQAMATIGESGVDEQAVINLQFPNGGLAGIDCGVRTSTEHAATIYGTDGRIVIPAPFWKGTEAQLIVGDDTTTFKQNHKANGYEYEAEAVAEALAAGQLEQPIVSHADSLAVMAVCDEARRQIGLRYPGE